MVGKSAIFFRVFQVIPMNSSMEDHWSFNKIPSTPRDDWKAKPSKFCNGNITIQSELVDSVLKPELSRTAVVFSSE